VTLDAVHGTLGALDQFYLVRPPTRYWLRTAPT
jgi:hypothetical protein